MAARYTVDTEPKKTDGNGSTMEQLKGTAVAYRGHLTRMYGQLDQLMKSYAPYKEVKLRRNELLRLFESFQNVSSEYLGLLPPLTKCSVRKAYQEETERKDYFELVFKDWVFEAVDRNSKSDEILQPPSIAASQEQFAIGDGFHETVCTKSGTLSGVGNESHSCRTGKSTQRSKASRASREAKMKITMAQYELDQTRQELKIKVGVVCNN
jgi:hypothetical protein